MAYFVFKLCMRQGQGAICLLRWGTTNTTRFSWREKYVGVLKVGKATRWQTIAPCNQFTHIQVGDFHSRYFLNWVVVFLKQFFSKHKMSSFLHSKFYMQSGSFHSFIGVLSHEVEVGGGFKYFLFAPLFGEDFQFD